jgi:alkanesulfonate monooxygenase SsuD/methylene tetrahydromethanopterin reductase-like flavin-dependent oxidoreductase (luciferase family)
VRFGVLLLPTAHWGELVERAQYLDELGFDGIYVADGLAHPLDPSRDWLDGWICLAGIAQATRRARIGTLVTSMIFRREAEVVHAAITMDHASNGRMELGIGSGDSEPDHELAEVANWPPRERAQRFHAYAARVRSLLDGDALTPRPVQERIPLTIAAQGRDAIRVAARYADTWNTYGGRRLSRDEGRELVRRRMAQFEGDMREAGRETDDVRRSLLLGRGFIAEDPFSSDDAFVEVVDAWREIGMDELVFYGLPERSDQYERIVREVMPSCS